MKSARQRKKIPDEEYQGNVKKILKKKKKELIHSSKEASENSNIKDFFF